MKRFRIKKLLSIVLLLPLIAIACSSSKSGSSTDSSNGGASELTGTLRLGYFPNLTHASALVGVANGYYAKALGPKVDFKTQVFNAGPDEVTALLSGALDAGYLGPGPAINAFQKSHGGVKIFSGATSGGASLIVKSDINSAADLKGKKVASPQLGGTQDIALRSWLKSQGLQTDAQGGGDVSITPQANADILSLFKQGAIAGAWVPEPWASRLVKEDGGKVLVDERTLWPAGKFVTTVLVVRTDFAKAHPALVKALIEGQVEATKELTGNPTAAKAVANQQLTKLSGKALSTDVLDLAWANLAFTNDPVISSLKTQAQHAKDAGLLTDTNTDGIFDHAVVDAVLRADGLAAVSS